MSDEPATIPSTPGLTADQSARLDDTVRSLCFIRPPVLEDDCDLVGDLGYDSLGLLELSAAVEQEFDLGELDESAAVAVRTVGDLRALVAGALG